jgi:hypothetical protein
MLKSIGGMMDFYRKLGFIFISIILCSVCGCGGGSSNTAGTLALLAAAPTDPGLTGTATATFADSFGRNPNGLEINFSTDRPDIIALDSTKATVGSNGQAQITFRTITPAVDTNVKVIASTGGLSAFQALTIKGSTVGGGGGGGTVVTPPPVVAANPSSISFISASPTSITLKGTGGAGRVETSIVTLQVRGVDGLPLAGQTVDFTLSTSVGGLSTIPTTAVSDTSGQVKTIVNAGVVSTPVRVFATVRGTSITTQSDELTVTTGIPDQDSFSMSAGNLNSRSFDHDGVPVPITVFLSDHFNNPVPVGTVVNFTTNAGQIIGSATTTNGSVTVDWTSSAPRPGTGRFVIMAYAIGEESFTDLSGEGLADAGEFTDDTEAFRDDNFNGVRNANEPFIDFNRDGLFNGGDGKYNGVLQGAAFLGAPRSKHVFANMELVMSTDGADITAVPASLAGPGSISITVRDLNGNTMASGTTIAVTSPGFGTLTGTTSFTVPQNTGNGQTISVNLAAGDAPVAKTGVITITVTSGGLATTLLVPVSGNF